VAAPGAAAAAAKAGKQAGAVLASKHLPAGAHTIAFLDYTSQATALRRVTSGMQAAASAIGWKFVTCDAQGNPATVASCASSFIQQKVSVIASVAIPQAAMNTEMQQARAASIPWISSGGQIPANETLFTGSFFYPEADLYRALDKTFFDALGSGSVDVIALQLTVDSTAHARQDQLAADLAAHPNIHVVDRIEGSPSNPAAATSAIETALQQHPSVKGIWSCCDILDQPIVQAVNLVNAGAGERPVIVGAFPDQAMLKAIRDGQMYGAAELPWEAYGWMAVDEAAQYLASGTPMTQHGAPTQYPVELYSGQIITKANVQQNHNALQAPVYDYTAYFTAKWNAEFHPGS
jgi:ABC-type sugar transport system substrate-binding protein